MRAATNFGMLDTDEDGVLTAAELDAPRQTMLRQRDFEKALFEGVFAERDTNKNGWLSLAEYRGGAGLDEATLFRKLDTDRNGRVSRSEFLKALPAATPLKVDSAMGDYDSNKDGKISRSEFQALAVAEFDRMDLNKDGVIRGAEQKLKCTRGFGGPTFLDPVEAVRPICSAARN